MEECNGIPLGWGTAAGISHGEKMPTQQPPCFCQLCQKNSLFAPPMGKQRADPHHCGGLHELQQPHHHSSRKMSPPVSLVLPPKSARARAICKFSLQPWINAALSCLQHGLFSLQLVLFSTSSAPVLSPGVSHNVTDTQINIQSKHSPPF